MGLVVMIAIIYNIDVRLLALTVSPYPHNDPEIGFTSSIL